MPTLPLPLVLLPGLDGTGRLFERFTRALPVALRPIVVAYPVEATGGLAVLDDVVESALPREGQFALLGESFSGPLAIRSAARHADRVAGVVLAATFAARPVGRLVAGLATVLGPAAGWTARWRPLVRFILAGPPADREIAGEVVDALARVPTSVLRARLQAVLACDERRTLAGLDVPVLALAPRRDRLIGSRAVVDLRAARPDLRVAQIDAPHMVLQAAPHACAGEVAAFLGCGGV